MMRGAYEAEPIVRRILICAVSAIVWSGPALADGADTVPPSSSWTSADGTVAMSGVQRLRGTSTDDVAVSSVAVKFVDALGWATTTSADINSCVLETSCVWSVTVPVLVPGTYTAIAKATDASGNLEPGGPAITVFVV
jgi:hypothetical protein